MIMKFDIIKTRYDSLHEGGVEIIFINKIKNEVLYFDGAYFDFITKFELDDKWLTTDLSGEILEIRQGDGEFVIKLKNNDLIRVLYMPNDNNKFGVSQTIIVINKDSHEYNKNLKWFEKYEEVKISR